MGSIKNVGTSAVDAIVNERNKNGEYKSFTDFCERIQSEAVNKKCIESLIKSGVFDEFKQTRSTLMASYEEILDSISDSSKKNFKGQVSMFDLGSENNKDAEEMEKLKYSYHTLKEYSDKELLSMEKEMLGLYISGHPLSEIKEQIEKVTNINSMKVREALDEEDETGKVTYKDGDIVRYAGIINSIKKKYTKNNKIMAFINIEDLYGSMEVIAFENAYQSASNSLVEENIVYIEGRVSIKEEDKTITLIANKIQDFTAITNNQNLKTDNNIPKPRSITINVTNLTEEQKEKLRGTLKFFAGDKNNTQVYILNNGETKPAGGIFLIDETLNEIKEIVGNENIE